MRGGRPAVIPPPLAPRWGARRTRSSAGEHLVDIEGVTGSIPVASTILTPSASHCRPHTAGCRKSNSAACWLLDWCCLLRRWRWHIEYDRRARGLGRLWLGTGNRWRFRRRDAGRHARAIVVGRWPQSITLLGPGGLSRGPVTNTRGKGGQAVVARTAGCGNRDGAGHQIQARLHEHFRSSEFRHL